MQRRAFLQMLFAATGGAALVSAVPAAAKSLRQKMKKAPTSVGKVKRVKFGGHRGWAFTLGPKKREDKPGENGRQRIEMRDHTPSAKGTVQYSLEFMFPAIDDPDGRLESKFIFFQLKPAKAKGARKFVPYLSVQIEPDYRRTGPFSDFEFQYGTQIGRPSSKPIQVNAWHRLDVIVKWSKGNDGYAQIMIDGQQISAFKGPTGPDMGEPLVNFGIYRSHLFRADPAKLETLHFNVRRYAVTRLSA